MPNQVPRETRHEHDESVQSFLLQSKHYLCGTEMKGGATNQNNNEEKHGDTNQL